MKITELLEAHKIGDSVTADGKKGYVSSRGGQYYDVHFPDTKETKSFHQSKVKKAAEDVKEEVEQIDEADNKPVYTTHVDVKNSKGDVQRAYVHVVPHRYGGDGTAGHRVHINGFKNTGRSQWAIAHMQWGVGSLESAKAAADRVAQTGKYRDRGKYGVQGTGKEIPIEVPGYAEKPAKKEVKHIDEANEYHKIAVKHLKDLHRKDSTPEQKEYARKMNKRALEAAKMEDPVAAKKHYMGVSEEAEHQDVAEENETFGKKSHQYKTTIKHIKNPTVSQRMAAHDIKPGVAGYRDRIAMLKDAEAQGNLKKEEVEDEATGRHKVTVTVSDPNHSAVTQRKEQIMKRVNVNADDKDQAVAKAKEFYKKKGYKVHGAEYHSGPAVKEEVEQIDEIERSYKILDEVSVGDFVKDPYGKTHRVVKKVDNMLHTSEYRGNNEYGGTSTLHVTKASKTNKPKDVKEETMTTSMEQYLAAITGNTNFADALAEKTLTKAELKKREEVAKAIEREHPGMEMGKKMAIATATAKKVAEQEIPSLRINVGEATEEPPFDVDKDSKGTITDKSGAKHGPMSRARHLARMALRKQIEKSKEPEGVKEEVEQIEENSPTGIKIYHKNKKGEEGSTVVFSARDAKAHEKELKQTGHTVTGRAVMYGEKEGPRKGVNEEFELDEELISYDDFRAKIDAHRKAGNKVVDDKYGRDKATYTTIDSEGYGRKTTHTDAGTRHENLGRVSGDDEEVDTQAAKPEKRGRGRPVGSKSGARRHK